MRRGSTPPYVAIAVVALIASACASRDEAPSSSSAAGATPPAALSPPALAPPPGPAPPTPPEGATAGTEPAPVADMFGAAPAVPAGPLAPELAADVERLFSRIEQSFDADATRRIGGSGDARVAWLLADLLRFIQSGNPARELLAAAEKLTGRPLADAPGGPWKALNDHLIAWDLPAPPGYVDAKRRLFTLVEPGWAPFFADPEAEIDWRLLTWGGVLIDDRPLGDGRPCPGGCIPALDDPAVTPAAQGDWYPDDAIVFGVVIGDEARAYPKNVMEVHELVNDTLGGRRIGMPYCTLCGAAQAYLTDTVGDEPLVLRTSGLLSRSNKVMYDLASMSVFDTFRGRALSGPLRDAGVVLEQVTVVTSTWGAWRDAHPETTIVARDGGIGSSYPEDPLGGRDDDGPIFPVGRVDPRLPVHEQVVGAFAADGQPLAFPADAARSALLAGGSVELAGVRLELDGDGLRAFGASGEPVVSHQSFWFAWSQFHPDVAVWTPLA